MSSTQNKAPEKQSKSFFSNFFSKSDNADPPPKEMKLGESGKQRYDKEKKRWVFEGETVEDTPELLPPPKSFAKSQDSHMTGTRKFYVDVLGQSNTNEPYRPANIEDKEEPEKEAKKTQDFLGFMDEVDEVNFPNNEDEKSENISKRVNLDEIQSFFDLKDLKFLQEKNEEKCENEDFFKSIYEKEELTQKILEKELELIRSRNDQDLIRAKFRKKTEKLDSEIGLLKTSLMSEVSLKEGKEKENLEVRQNLEDEKLKNQGLEVLVESLKSECSLEKLKNKEIDKEFKEISEKIHTQSIEVLELNKNLESVRELNTKYINRIQEIEEINQSLSIDYLEINKKLEENIEKNKMLEDYNGQLSKKVKKIESDNKILASKNKDLAEKSQSLNEELDMGKKALVLVQKSYFDYIKKVNDLELENMGLEERIKYLSTIVPESLENTHLNNFEEDEWKQMQESLRKIYKDRSDLQMSYESLLQDYKNNREGHYLELDHEKLKYDNAVNKTANELSNEKLLSDQLKQQISLFKQELAEKNLVIKDIHTKFNEDLKKIKDLKEGYKDKIKILSEKIKIQAQYLEEKNSLISHLSSQNRALQETINDLEKPSENKLVDSCQYLELVKDYESSQQSLRILSQEIEKISEKLREKEKAEEEFNRLNSKLNEDLLETCSENKDLKENISSLTTENGCFQIKIKDLNDQILDLNNQVDSLTKENSVLSNKLEETSGLQNTINELSLEIRNLNEFKENASQEIQEFSDFNNELKLNQQTLTEKLSDLQIEKKESMLKIENLESLNESLSLNIKGLENQLILERETTESIESELDDLKKANFSEHFNLNQIILELTKSNEKLMKKNEDLQRDHEDLEKDLKTSKENNEKLLDDYKSLQSRNEELLNTTKESSKYFEILLNQDKKIEQLEIDLKQKNEELLNTQSELISAQQSLENELGRNKSRIQELELELNSKNADQSKVQNEKQTNEIKKLKENETRLKEEVKNLNEDIENMCQKNLELSQKLSSINSYESTLKEKAVEIASLHDSVKIKEGIISKLGQRLKEKDEELELAKDLYKQIMSQDPGRPIEVEEVKEQLIEENAVDEGKPVTGTENVGWLASMLSAVFLTDSERGEVSK